MVVFKTEAGSTNMFTAIFTAMLPQSVTEKGLAWTQAAREAPTYFRARVVRACYHAHYRLNDASWRVLRSVDGASDPVADALVGAITPVHEQMERVHLDAKDRAYRAKVAQGQEILAVVESSPLIKELFDRLNAQTDRVETLTFLCLGLLLSNTLVLFKHVICPECFTM